MCVAVEREVAAGHDRALGKRVVEVLPGRVAIELDGNALPRSEREHRVRIGDDPRARPRDATAWMGENVHGRVLNRGKQPAGLILCLSKARVRGCQHEFELQRLVRGEIEP